ncbi:MAG: hypothetical protein ABEJ89_08470 [Haloarculaceae archaeon]
MGDREVALREHASRYLQATSPSEGRGVLAMLLAGSLAAGHADEYADVDLDTVVDWSAAPTTEELTDRLVPDGATVQQAHAEKCSFDWDGEHVDIDIVDRESIESGDWTLTTRWEYDNAEILWDPTGRVTTVLTERIPFEPGERAALVSDRVEDLLWTGGWDVYKACLRDDRRTAHALATEAAEAMVEVLFLRDEAFVPRTKWRRRELTALDPVDETTEDLLWTVQKVTATTVEDVHRRIVALRDLWNQVRPTLTAQALIDPGHTWHVDTEELLQIE